jgi:hypothetical protein
VKTLEEITYDAGRHALADQEALVAGIRQRTGTLLAAHALVASFLGVATLKAHGLSGWAWVALVALVVALSIAAVLLAPWRLPFAVDARDIYRHLSRQAREQVDTDGLPWLVAAALAYQRLRDGNLSRVRWMSVLSALLSALIVVQTLAWIAGLLG